jgi:hypothetical protein
MTKREILLSLALFLSALFLFGYIAFKLELLKPNAIVVECIQTTGPDYYVVFGDVKLYFQTPDSLKDTDVGGVMVTGTKIKSLHKFMNDNYLTYSDYFVFNFKIVGWKQSDSFEYHPLLELSEWKHISKLTLWLMLILEFVLLGSFALVTRKMKGKRKLTPAIKHAP